MRQGLFSRYSYRMLQCMCYQILQRKKLVDIAASILGASVDGTREMQQHREFLEKDKEYEDCAGLPRGTSNQQELHNSQPRLHSSRNCAPLSLCVCVVSEQYRLAKVLRCRECDLRLNWQGYNAVTTVYTRLHCYRTSTKECTSAT